MTAWSALPRTNKPAVLAGQEIPSLALVNRGLPLWQINYRASAFEVT